MFYAENTHLGVGIVIERNGVIQSGCSTVRSTSANGKSLSGAVGQMVNQKHSLAGFECDT